MLFLTNYIYCLSIIINQQINLCHPEEILATFAPKKDTSLENVLKKKTPEVKEETEEIDQKETTEVILHHYSGNRDRPQANKCYNCQGTGHFARDCTAERVERQDRPERT
jgi:hypothetical protein